MPNENNESKKIVLGLVAGAAVGASLIYLLTSARSRRTNVIHKIGKTMCELGEALENCKVENFTEIAHEVQKTFPQGSDVISNLANWMASAMNLWKKIKDGGQS